MCIDRDHGVRILGMCPVVKQEADGAVGCHCWLIFCCCGVVFLVIRLRVVWCLAVVKHASCCDVHRRAVLSCAELLPWGPAVEHECSTAFAKKKLYVKSTPPPHPIPTPHPTCLPVLS